MRVLFRALAILIAASSLCSSCGRSDNKTEFIGLDENLDFGKGIYRPNPFKFLDKIPPFSWMGMPDSVKKETELEISFNEDAVRSHSSGQLALVDQNGNIINGIIIGNKSNKFLFEATLDSVVIPISFNVDPSIGDSILRGSVVVIGNDLDQVNNAKLSSLATPVASWTLRHEIGINWLRWLILILIVVITLFLIYIIGCLIYGASVTAIENLSYASLPAINIKRNQQSDIKDKKRQDTDEEDNDGRYVKEIKPSIYKINRNYVIPDGSQHKNPQGKTCGQLLDELNDNDGIIVIQNGEPLFDKDGGTLNGKPLKASFPEGIDSFLKPEELKRGTKINRNKLHDEAFRRIAKGYGMDSDELQVFKGNSAPVEKLMCKWNCSEQEVFNRCRNPHRIARVLHECKDGKTVQLVPWVYHHISHSGGIEAVASKY